MSTDRRGLRLWWGVLPLVAAAAGLPLLYSCNGTVTPQQTPAITPLPQEQQAAPNPPTVIDDIAFKAPLTPIETSAPVAHAPEEDAASEKAGESLHPAAVSSEKREPKVSVASAVESAIGDFTLNPDRSATNQDGSAFSDGRGNAARFRRHCRTRRSALESGSDHRASNRTTGCAFG